MKKSVMIKAAFLSVIISGLWLRFLFPMQRVFDFDQEQIALAAKTILTGKLTLIGPLANTISFFTGPLIYYLSAIFYGLTGGHPLANAITGVGIYLITVVVLWFFLRRFVKPSLVLLFLGIYSFSDHLVLMDRITWNPNLSFLSSALVLSGLLFARGKAAYAMGFLGMWLAYQAHFAGFILVAELAVLCLWLKRWKYLLFSLLGLMASLLPTFVFDLRHDWLNGRGLWQMIINPQKVSGDWFVFERFGRALLVSLENVTKIVIPLMPRWSLVGLGMLIIWFWLAQKKSVFSLVQKYILIIWILIFPVIIAFYDGSTPEYYYLMQLPAFVFIFSDIIIGIRGRSIRLGILLAMFCISFGSVYDHGLAFSGGASLGNKLKAIQYIKENDQLHPANLVLDMEIRDRFGWEYLIDYARLPRGENKVKTHVIYPVNSATIVTTRFGGVGVWVDKREEVDAQAYIDEKNGVLFYYPNEYWQLDLDQPFTMSAFAPQGFSRISVTDKAILYLTVPKNEINKYTEVFTHSDQPTSLDRWQSVGFIEPTLTGRKTLKRERWENTFIFSFPKDYTWKEIEFFLSKVEGI